MEKDKTFEESNEYPFDNAVMDIAHWSEYVGSGLDLPRAYLLYKRDLESLLDELNVLEAKGEVALGVRCYPARDASTGLNHLLVAAVLDDADKVKYPFGKDIYSEEGPSLIFDLTRPCPRMCDIESALFKAGRHEVVDPMLHVTPPSGTK